MSQLISSSGAPASGERRVNVRFPCGQAAFCCALEPRDHIFWTARARNISTTGIRLVLSHHFGPGTMLAVELLSADQSIGQELPVRVVYANTEGEGGWMLGCEFIEHLSEAELVALL